MGDYQLSTEIIGHEGSVRALCVLNGGEFLLSGGEDGSVKKWIRMEAANGDTGTTTVTYENIATVLDAEHWVIALIALPPGVLPEAPQGGFVSASQDKLIRVYDAEGNRMRVLVGHANGVISLSWDAAGHLLSGSWDGTAKVWDVARGECVATLGDQENGVTVLGLPNGTIATASTGREQQGQIVDVQIRLWKDGKVIKSIKKHQGPIRSLSLVPSLGFMSTSNDGTVQAWSLEGDELACLSLPPGRDGQPVFIFDGCAVEGGQPGAIRLVSGGEDGSACIWEGDGLRQQLAHPRGLWAVTSLANGDVVTGCQDSVIRIFTQDPTRAAPPEVAEGFARAVADAQAAAARGGPTQEELANLPDWLDRGAHPGRREGMVQMFKKDGKAIAAQWSTDSMTWIEIGEVMGSTNAGTINGVAYDHVFPIEIEQADGGVNKLQIGYNNDQNPFQAAQTFIDANMLPQHYLGQIADYIMQRAKQAAPMIGDPSGASGASSSSSSRGVPTSQHFPKVGYLVFDAGQLDKIIAKIQEFGGEIGESAWTDKDQAALSSLAATLGATSRYHATEVRPAEVSVVGKILSWPDDKTFPGLDLFRLMVTHPTIKGGIPPALIDRALSLGESNPSSTALVLLSLRLASNLLQHQPIRNTAKPFVLRAVSLAGQHATSANKTIRNAAATLLLNLAVLATEDPSLLPALTGPLTSALTAFVAQEQEDESLYRALVGVGTLAVAHKSLPPGLADAVRALAGQAVSRHLSLRVEECLADVGNFLR